MPTSIMPQPLMRFFDNAARPANGHLLYTYAAGTNTPKATYQDAAGMVPHTNPIVLDGKGEALVYWDGNYKVDLKSASGTQITGFPVDNFESSSRQVEAQIDTLRADLAVVSGGTQGATKIGFNGGTLNTFLRKSVSLRLFGANANSASITSTAGADCWTALQAADAEGATVYRLEYVPGETNIAYFSAFDTDFTLPGKTLDIDPRITVSVPNGGIPGSANGISIRHINPTRYYLRSLNNYYTANPEGGELHVGKGAVRVMPQIGPDDVELGFPVGIAGTSCQPRTVSAFLNSDTFSASTFSATTAKGFTFSPPNTPAYHIGMMPCKPGDEFVCSFSATGAPAIAAMVRHSEGFGGVYSGSDYFANSATSFEKVTGAAGVNGAINFLGAGTHGSYSGLGSTWTIRIDSWKKYSILLNGYVVARKNTPGYIFECGFGGYPNGAGETISVADIVRMRGAKSRGSDMVSVRIYGDSKTADRYDSWPTYFRDALEFAVGIRVQSVVNRAVAGHDSSSQLGVILEDSMAGVGLVIIDIGTNDTQGAVSVAAFLSNLAAMVNYAKTNGVANIILCVPSLWYTQGQAGERGQLSSNYDRGAPYRSAVMRLAADTGCKVIDNTRFDGPVIANYVNSALSPDLTAAGDPVVYDNIHPTTESNKRRALAVAKVAAGFYTRARGNLYAARHDISGFLNGWQATIQTPSVAISDDGTVSLFGVIDAGGAAIKADGTTIFQLPSYLWPAQDIRRRVVSSLATESAVLTVTVTGAIQISGIVSSTWVDISSLSGYGIENREDY